MSKRLRPARKDLIKASQRGGTKEDTEKVKKAKEKYRRKWKAGLKAEQRERYRQKRKSTTVLENFPGEKNELVKTSILALGSIQKRYNTCGKKDCPCMLEGKKHGPYYYLALPLPKEMVAAGHPRIKYFYVTADEAWLLGERIKNFKRLQDEAWDELWNEFTRSGMD